METSVFRNFYLEFVFSLFFFKPFVWEDNRSELGRMTHAPLAGPASIAWDRTKLGAGNAVQGFCVSGREIITWAISCCLLGVHGWKPSALMKDGGIPVSVSLDDNYSQVCIRVSALISLYYKSSWKFRIMYIMLEFYFLWALVYLFIYFWVVE